MGDDRDMTRVETQIAAILQRTTELERSQTRADERLNNHKDRIDRMETGQRNVVMAVIGIVITAVLRTIGFVQ